MVDERHGASPPAVSMATLCLGIGSPGITAAAARMRGSQAASCFEYRRFGMSDHSRDCSWTGRDRRCVAPALPVPPPRNVWNELAAAEVYSWSSGVPGSSITDSCVQRDLTAAGTARPQRYDGPSLPTAHCGLSGMNPTERYRNGCSAPPAIAFREVTNTGN